MTERHNGNNSGILSFDPNSQGQGQRPTQGQGQEQFNVDPTNRGDLLAASEVGNEGRGHIQRQGQGQQDPITHSSHLDSRLGGEPNRVTNQPADPDLGRHAPPRTKFDDQTRLSGPGGQEHGHPDQQGKWRRAGENVPYGGGGKDPVVGGPHERFDAGNHGPSTHTGPGSMPGAQGTRNDGPFGGKPPIPERVMGTVEKVVGKATGNAKMYEHGERHQTQGY